MELQTQILVVGSEQAETFQKYWHEEDFPFIGLPDPDHTIQNLYGQEVKALKLGRMPAQVLVDKAGVIRFAHYGDSMADIPSPGDLMEFIRQEGSAWLKAGP